MESLEGMSARMRGSNTWRIPEKPRGSFWENVWQGFPVESAEETPGEFREEFSKRFPESIIGRILRMNFWNFWTNLQNLAGGIPEKNPGGIHVRNVEKNPGGISRTNSWSNPQRELLEKSPEGTPGEIPKMNCWRNSKKELLQESSKGPFWGISGKNFWGNSQRNSKK